MTEEMWTGHLPRPGGRKRTARFTCFKELPLVFGVMGAHSPGRGVENDEGFSSHLSYRSGVASVEKSVQCLLPQTLKDQLKLAVERRAPGADREGRRGHQGRWTNAWHRREKLRPACICTRSTAVVGALHEGAASCEYHRFPFIA